jgi:hypothetical protein
MAGGLVALASLAGCQGYGTRPPGGAHLGAHLEESAPGHDHGQEEEAPGQPAKTLSPDPLDAPAATSVADAQRSAEMAEEMSGGGGPGGHGGDGGHEGHEGHGAGTYRQVDAGRGTEAPGHEPHRHGAANEEENEAAAGYVCPMHPEVTSAAPGKCPKCGMDLVKRRKG